MDFIDGPAGTLGFAGPDYIRLGTLDGSFGGTLSGIMVFDEADVALMRAEGVYETVVLHEMGECNCLQAVHSEFNDNAHNSIQSW